MGCGLYVLGEVAAVHAVAVEVEVVVVVVVMVVVVVVVNVAKVVHVVKRWPRFFFLSLGIANRIAICPFSIRRSLEGLRFGV